MSLHAALKQLLSLEDDLARMLVGEPSFNDLSIKVLAVLRIREPEFSLDYERLHHKITYVNEVRRWVAHKPFVGEGDNLLFSNIIIAKSTGAIKGYVCTTTQLNDLSRLVNRLNNTVAEIKPESTSTPASFRLLVDELLAFAETLDLPPSPDHKPPANQKAPKAHPKAPPPHAPSAE